MEPKQERNLSFLEWYWRDKSYGRDLFGPILQLSVRRKHCERISNTIEKTVSFAFDVEDNGSKVNELIEHLHTLAVQGIRWFWGPRATPLEVIRWRVIPAASDFCGYLLARGEPEIFDCSWGC
jgi:hypothetical protein